VIMNALQISTPRETSMVVSERDQASPSHCPIRVRVQVQFQHCFHFELQSQNLMVQE